LAPCGHEPVVICGDCKDEVAKMDADSVDLVFTSPPYGNQRKDTYGGVAPDGYVEWFLPISQQIMRVLKPTGTFVLNIKEHVEDGERHTYVMELVLAMKRQGWRWTEQYIWHKKTSFPGKFPGRFRDAWEHLFQFNKSSGYNIYKDAVRVPIGDWRKGPKSCFRRKESWRSATGSGLTRSLERYVDAETVYPTNVLHMSPVNRNVGHSAAFPEGLAKFFVDLFTVEGDVVLDPFCGSGTVLKVAREGGRRGIGIEIVPEYAEKINDNLRRWEEERLGGYLKESLWH